MRKWSAAIVGGIFLLRKYVRRAQTAIPSLKRPGISPHTLRHTKTMHLLQAGVPLVTIKDREARECAVSWALSGNGPWAPLSRGTLEPGEPPT